MVGNRGARFFCDVIDVGRPLRCSSITHSYPFHTASTTYAMPFSSLQHRRMPLPTFPLFLFCFFSIENTTFNRCSLFDAHFDAPCINKIAASAQMTLYVDVTSLASCQDLAPYCAKVWRRYWIRRK